MTDNKEVLAWVKELGQQAFTEARNGNTAMLNRVGVNSALKMFLDNVVGTGNIMAESFPAFYPIQWAEIVRLHEEYKRDEKVTESVDKVAELESRFVKFEETVLAELRKLTESAEPAAKKPAKKAVKVEETEIETTEADAESEA